MGVADLPPRNPGIVPVSWPAALPVDDEGWGRLLGAYEPYLLLLVRVQIGRRLQGKVDAADVVQETLLDAHRQLRNFRGTTEAEWVAWLRRILTGQLAGTFRHYLGTQARDVHLERELDAELLQSSHAIDDGLLASLSTPSQHLARREQTLILTDALNRLPEAYREVIVLRNLEALPFAEVARRMGRSEDSVQKLWLRGLGSLREAMRSLEKPSASKGAP
jgi:RNA polymerase sigma-70 factor (ECF subfamily)